MERASDTSKVNGHFVLPVGLEVTACSNTTTADVNLLNPQQMFHKGALNFILTEKTHFYVQKHN